MDFQMRDMFDDIDRLIILSYLIYTIISIEDETQSSLPAAFPFGGPSLHECYITERNGTGHTQILE